MKAIHLFFLLVFSIQVSAQFNPVKLKKDTLTRQPTPSQPVQLQPAGNMIKEEVSLAIKGNMAVNPSKLELYTTNDISHQLTMRFKSSYDGTKAIFWLSEDPSIASVNNNGWVNAVRKGNTRIRAVTADGRDTAWCSVYVFEANAWGNLKDAGNGRLSSQNNWIYFANPKDQFKLYKMDWRGQSLKKLSDDSPDNIQVVGRWIYYNSQDGIVQIDLDGGQRKIIDNRYILLRVNKSGFLYCYNDKKVLGLDLTKPNQAMEAVFEDQDDFFGITLDQFYMYYTKYWENSPDNHLTGGVYRYAWSTRQKEEIVPVNHIIHGFAVEENHAILYYDQGGSNTVRVPYKIFGKSFGSTGDPVSTAMYSTTNTYRNSKRIPQITEYARWTLINDWVYYFAGNELRRCKSEGKMDQNVGVFHPDYEIYVCGDFLILYSGDEGKIFRMLMDGRNVTQIL